MANPTPPLYICSYNCMRKRCPNEQDCPLSHHRIDKIEKPFFSVAFRGQHAFRMVDSDKGFVFTVQQEPSKITRFIQESFKK